MQVPWNSSPTFTVDTFYRLRYNRGMIMSTPKTKMTLKQAADYIGVTEGRLRQLIREGSLKAEKIAAPMAQGFYYLVSESEAKRLKNNVPTVGRPRRGSA